ncbi:MAG: DUF5333 family protein [Pseudomonadota bacterium]
MTARSTLKVLGVSAVCVAVLAACTQQSGGPAKGMPDYFYNALLSSELARTLARECGGPIAYNDDTWNDRLPQLEQQLLSDGYTTRDLQQILSEVPVDRIRSDTEAFIADNSLQSGQAQSFCAAGRAEIANGSEIGSFLRTSS